MAKHPARFTINVPIGNVPPHQRSAHPESQYRARVPINPAKPIQRILYTMLCSEALRIHALITCMKVTEILQGWKTILAGRAPFLSIELTKECPLSCPGCYAYGDDHLGGSVILTQVSDFKGQQLVSRFMDLIDRYQPLHVSIVGCEP